METTESKQQKLRNLEIDYFKIGKILLSRWFWIAGTTIFGLLMANVFLWYTPKTYSTFGTLKFDEKKSEVSDIISVPSNADRAPSKIQSETVVLQSTPLLLNAVRRLDYLFSFYIKGRYFNHTDDLYPQKPLHIDLVQFDSLNFFRKVVTFTPVDQKKFSVSYVSSGKVNQKLCDYDRPFSIGPTKFKISYPGDIPKTTVLLFKLNSAEDFIDRVKNGLHITEVAKNSNIIFISETGPNPWFAADMVNAIMKEYLNYDLGQRVQSASQMIKFLDVQLGYLANDVKGSQNSIKNYQESKKIMDVASATTQAFEKAKELESQRSLLKIQLIAIDQLKQEIFKEKDNLSLSFNLAGAVEQQLGDYIISLNNLIKERHYLLNTYNNNSQPVEDVNQQIISAKNSALNSLNSSVALIGNKIKYLNNELLPVDQQLSSMPAAERDMVTLRRDFEINDKVYSFLSEKKLDAQITRAGILPGATILELAQTNLVPVAPDENAIRRSALMLGLGAGLLLIVLIRFLNPFIYDKETVESLTTVPVIGVIRKFPGEIDEFNTQIIELGKSKSIFAESIRSVRTNLNFLASEKQSKVICITSDVAGEGKSFAAINLSYSLSLINKKVILISADLRRSKLHKTFNVPNNRGLSNYLAHQCTVAEIIDNKQIDFDFIVSGTVPPNPSELLQSSRMGSLIAELKQKYDVIMIDTAPIGLVSDAIPLIRMSDINVFVIRAGKSKFYSATLAQRIAHQYYLNNTVIILNAFARDLLHSRYYSSRFTGEDSGAQYYYSDYTSDEKSDYYNEEKTSKWWDITRWFK
jgi:capsular exopolysaccharide synthesis family protein